MKKAMIACMIAGALGGIGVQAGRESANGQNAKVLGNELFAEMDGNHDGEVSRKEYVDFGTNYMRQKGCAANPGKMEKVFATFDLDGNGSITELERQPPRDNSVVNLGRIHVSCEIGRTSAHNEEQSQKEKKNGEFVEIYTDTTTKTETLNLTVNVCNPSTRLCPYTLEWYCFSKPVHLDQIKIHDQGSEAISVQARDNCKYTVTPKTMTYIEESVQRGGYGDAKINERGETYAGYLVILKHGDAILDKEASSKRYLDDEWIAQL